MNEKGGKSVTVRNRSRVRPDRSGRVSRKFGSTKEGMTGLPSPRLSIAGDGFAVCAMANPAGSATADSNMRARSERRTMVFP